MQKDNGPVVNGTPTSSYRCCEICDVVPASTTVNYVEGDAYDALHFGQSSKPFEHNSILFIPDLLSKQECQDLCQECEARVCFQDANPNSWLAASKTTRHENLPFERHEIKDLSQGTQTFFERLLRERLVPFISKEMPEEVEENIWENMSIQWCLPNLPLHTTQQNISFEQHHTNHLEQQQELQELQQQDKGNRHLAHQTFKFSESEPTINRYTQGGVFPPHRDVLAFTLNVLLSNQFIGGGTQFWEEVGTPEEKKVWNATATRKEHATNPLEAKEPTLCMLPKVGVGEWVKNGWFCVVLKHSIVSIQVLMCIFCIQHCG